MLLQESKWTKMFFGEGQASLSFSHLNKDDEGLYTLRIVSRGGVSDHSAFLFVRGGSQGWGRGRDLGGWARPREEAMVPILHPTTAQVKEEES